MVKRERALQRGIWMAGLAVIGLVAASFVTTRGTAQEEAAAEPAPPADQTYLGVKECASCHFKQFMSWMKTPHAKTFDLLPDEYKTNEKCLECHTTGYGKESGFKDVATTPSLVGTSCEACHGPGSKHAEIARGMGKDQLTPEQEKTVRDSIWKILPSNACVKCHTVAAHGESQTPPELRKKD